MSFIYNQLGLEFFFELSTRPDNYLGELEQWDKAEEQLIQVLNNTGKEWKLNPKDGAFYGPKIDYKIKDCFGRKHQLGTIQLDFNLPQRFNLQFKSHVTEKQQEEKGEKEGKKEEPEQVEKEEEETVAKVGENEEENLKEEEKKYSVIKPLKAGFERPVIIHRAILGSLERCIAILIEHYGGKWPFWLSPR